MAGPLSSCRNAPAGSFCSFFLFDDGPPPPDDEEEDINARVLRPYLITAESGRGELLVLKEEEEENFVLLDDDNFDDEGENADKSREEDVDVMFFSLYLSIESACVCVKIARARFMNGVHTKL